MHRKLTMLLGFLVAIGGCSQATSPPARASVAKQPQRTVAAAEPSLAPASPGQTLAEADALYRLQLGASRAGQFEVDRQIVELRRAVLLYQRFLDLADGRPELEPAVRKSHEAIADLTATLDFLLRGRVAEGEAPAAEQP
jgi:hypothetical protein